MKRSYVIVGAGIGGLIAAWRILVGDPKASITIIERNTYPGGLLAGIEYPNGLYFDIGTHIFQETGITEVDSFIQDAVPPEDLIIFELEILQDHSLMGYCKRMRLFRTYATLMILPL